MDVTCKPSREVTIRAISRRPRKSGVTHTVTWSVAGHGQRQVFHHARAARDLHNDLEQARSRGELFDTVTGLPRSMLRRLHPDLVLIERSELERLIASCPPDQVPPGIRGTE